jgi:hypothetical protein
MLIWLLVLLIIAGEVGAVYAWRQRKFPRPRWLFNMWAPTIYALLLLGAWLVGTGVAGLLAGADPDLLGTQRTLLALAMFTVLALLAIVGLTLFFRWVINTDMNDVSDKRDSK